ncbi:DUF3489 domain-containing protein [Roseisalinus antarcticus]|uniref:DUF3489 domain-containing protein n=1 Tax=Roseisalinus antarcticus TaxID=254357 RepID=A0A1Y5U652_9RHOB|nr:DUF3489 domain-containing protein [Roseisalinus antarcticus]SLN77724.1 hypothetical protein ROA7023_04487 [Roseisalinus antarcticus]
MPKLTDTQTIILSRAATRPDNLAMPLPEGLRGAAAKMSVTKMIERGWLEEVDADLRKGEPLWRETGDGHGTTLIATGTGLEAIGIEPVVAFAVSNLRKVKPDPADAPKPVAIRAGTKQARVIALLQRPEGAAICEIVEATGWMAHSARGMISGALKKKLGLPVSSEKVAGRGTVYKLDQTV